MSFTAVAQAGVPEQEPTSWFEQFWKLPVIWFFAPPASTPESGALIAPFPAAPPVPACQVAPLPQIEDTSALAFEANVGSAAVVDTDGLTPATARALTRFEQVVTSVGGNIMLTSAYRPSAYQEHLQAVWDKWMLELRDNDEEGCQTLKAQVDNEFTRHQLLATQRPVPVSDHTLGIGFDAAVTLPVRGRARRRRVSLDTMARRVGILRPDVFHDPVHFRLIGGRA